MARALAAVLESPRQLRMREFAIPEVGRDAGILRVEACGLCGTDYEQWQGHLRDFGGGMPIIPGHEVLGHIEAIGPEAATHWKVKEGDRVAIEPVIPCGHCSQCVLGAYTRCEADMGYGLYHGIARPPSLWGGYATHLYLHPRSMVHRLPAGTAPALPASLRLCARIHFRSWNQMKPSRLSGAKATARPRLCTLR
jgi:D-arabinose 1-dehydrogenase-like Zn-dependent alcohol dehydrogenase